MDDKIKAAAPEKQHSLVLPMDGVVTTLNNFLKLDTVACRELFTTRVKVNPDVANHPTLQVGGTDAKPTLGVLGLLNGLLEPSTGQRVAGMYDNDELVGFKIYTPPA